MNRANKLTLIRILLVPIFVIFMYLNFPNSRLVAALIFMAASFTDFLDGYYARRLNLTTTFGKFADPLADKILVAAALICLVEVNIIPAWATIIIIAREFAITGFRIIAASNDITIAASKYGKLKTITQLISLSLLLLGFQEVVTPGLVLFYISVVFTIISGFDYILKNKQVLDLENI